VIRGAIRQVQAAKAIREQHFILDTFFRQWTDSRAETLIFAGIRGFARFRAALPRIARSQTVRQMTLARHTRAQSGPAAFHPRADDLKT